MKLGIRVQEFKDPMIDFWDGERLGYMPENVEKNNGANAS